MTPPPETPLHDGRADDPRARLWLIDGGASIVSLTDALGPSGGFPFVWQAVPRDRALVALASQLGEDHPVDLVLAHAEQLPPLEQVATLLDPLQRRRGAGLVVLGPPADWDPAGRDRAALDGVTLLPWPVSGPVLVAGLAGAARARRLAAERLDLWEPWAGGGAALPGWDRAVAAADATLLLWGGCEVEALALARRVHHHGPRAAGPFQVLGRGEAPGEGVRRALGGTLFLPQLTTLSARHQGELTGLLAGRPRRHGPTARIVAWAAGESDAAALPAALLYRLNVLRLDLVDAGPTPDVAPARGAVPARLEDVEREHIERVLSECRGNRSEAARRLGMHRATLHAKLRRWSPA